jgi:hypothetical protein
MKLFLTLLAILVGCAAAAVPARAADLPASSCVSCHTNADLFEAPLLVSAEHFAGDAHLEAGISCDDCHGGNADPALAEDAEAAMDRAFRPRPFVGKPERGAIPDFCGRCHSDPVAMKKYRPELRVDQLTEYWTSRHGQALKAGDVNVATCVDCHGVHGIRRASDPNSSVYPTHVAETCSHCHADPVRMASYKLPNGQPLPVDQYAKWQRSVHAASMFEKEDLSAPTCNDCHGNHGAVPPGVESVGFVCGQCHGREAALFAQSPKHAGFQRHNEYLAQVGSDGCAGCHDASEPQAAMTSVRGFTECATCHGNHAIIRPTVGLLGPLPETPCAFCHEGSAAAGAGDPEPGKALAHYTDLRDKLLADAGAQNLEGDARFDWLVRQARLLPPHTLAGSGADGAVPELRPEFARLFQKFRIGETSFTFTDPATGQEVRESVMRCTMCHGESPASGADPVGYDTAKNTLAAMQDLTGRTAKAERVFLAARRGGVEVKGALIELDKAVDNQIELEVLVHAFSASQDGAFAKKHAEGIQHADAALASGRAALRELGHRRGGLGVALIFVALTLIGLAIKIRDSTRSSRS